MPHALLITGAPGIGKELFALAFGASLLCENRNNEDGLPCGNCNACHWLALDNHPDLRVLRPSALETGESEGKPEKKGSFEITIDQVRGLDDFLRVGGHRQGQRVIVISPAEAMNRSTANALLKSLEEPGPGVQFILVSSRAEEILPTVRSRCQRLVIPRPDKSVALEILREYDPGTAEANFALSGGSPFTAIQYFEPGAAALLRVWLSTVKLGSAIDPLAASAGVDGALTKSAKGGEMRTVIDWMQRWVHDLALASIGQSPRFFPSEGGQMKRLAEGIGERNLFLYNKLLVKHKKLSEHPLNSRLFLNQIFSEYRDLFTTETSR